MQFNFSVVQRTAVELKWLHAVSIYFHDMNLALFSELYVFLDLNKLFHKFSLSFVVALDMKTSD